VSPITLTKSGFIHEVSYVKIVMFICMYKKGIQIKKYIFRYSNEKLIVKIHQYVVIFWPLFFVFR